MANIKFLESGSAATQGLEFWAASSATASSVSSPSFSGGRSIKLASVSGLESRAQSIKGILGTTNRISFYYQTDTLPATSTHYGILSPLTNGSLIVFSVGLATTAGGVTNLVLRSGNGTVLATGSITISANTWYRIAIAYSISSTTVNSFVTFVNGVADLSAVNVTLTISGSDNFWCGLTGVSGDVIPNPTNAFVQNVYIDDGSTLDDPGDIRVTAKQPTLTNTNNWNTTVGTGAVNERPISTTNGVEESANQAQAAQNYTLQTAAAGDVDISTAIVVGRTAWVYGKLGTTAAGATFGTSAVANSVGTTGTTLAVPLTASVGDLVVVSFADQVGGTTPTIADVGLNTYTILAGPTTNTVRKTSWFSRVTANPSTITITFASSAKSRAAVAMNFTGAIVSPLDKNPTDANDSTSPYDAPTSTTLTQASEIVLGTFALAGPGEGTTSGPDAATPTDIIATSTETAVVTTGSRAIQLIDTITNTKSGGSGTTTLVTTALTTQVGDLILVNVADRIGSGTMVVTDSLGNTYTALNASTNTTRMTPTFTVVVAGKSGSTTYTATHTSSNAACAIVVNQYRAVGGTVFTTTPMDVNPANSTGTGLTTGPATGTLTQTPELIIVFAADSTTAGSQTYSGAGTVDFNFATAGTASGATAGIGTQFSAATIGVTPNATCSQSVAGVRGTVSFKGTPAEDSTTAITYRIVNVTTAVAPEITNSSADRTGVVGTATFKANSQGSASPQLTDNGVDNALTLTTSNSLYTVITTSATYPSNVAGIGMQSTGAAPETFLYECGTLIAYTSTVQPVVQSEASQVSVSCDDQWLGGDWR